MKYIIKTADDIAEAMHSMRKLRKMRCEDVATELDILPKTLRLKEKNATEFKASEIATLAKLYGFEMVVSDKES